MNVTSSQRASSSSSRSSTSWVLTETNGRRHSVILLLSHRLTGLTVSALMSSFCSNTDSWLQHTSSSCCDSKHLPVTSNFIGDVYDCKLQRAWLSHKQIGREACVQYSAVVSDSWLTSEWCVRPKHASYSIANTTAFTTRRYDIVLLPAVDWHHFA